MDKRQIYRTSRAAQESQNSLALSLISLIPLLLSLFQGKRKPGKPLNFDDHK
jgi:hypothetical protein